MIPLSQIIANVRLRHESQSSVRWGDADITDAINDGLEDLSEVTRFYERHVNVPVANLRTYYNLRGWLPEEALGVTSVWNTATSSWLDPIVQSELGNRWERAVGKSLSFFMMGFFWMAVVPRSSTATGVFRVHFAAQAPKFTFPQAVLSDLPDDFVTALEDYALYDMAAQDGESQMALLYFTSYNNRAQQLANFVERRTVRARTLRMGVF